MVIRIENIERLIPMLIPGGVSIREVSKGALRVDRAEGTGTIRVFPKEDSLKKIRKYTVRFQALIGYITEGNAELEVDDKSLVLSFREVRTDHLMASLTVIFEARKIKFTKRTFSLNEYPKKRTLLMKRGLVPLSNLQKGNTIQVYCVKKKKIKRLLKNYRSEKSYISLVM